MQQKRLQVKKICKLVPHSRSIGEYQGGSTINSYWARPLIKAQMRSLEEFCIFKKYLIKTYVFFPCTKSTASGVACCLCIYQKSDQTMIRSNVWSQHESQQGLLHQQSGALCQFVVFPNSSCFCQLYNVSFSCVLWVCVLASYVFTAHFLFSTHWCTCNVFAHLLFSFSAIVVFLFVFFFSFVCAVCVSFILLFASPLFFAFCVCCALSMMGKHIKGDKKNNLAKTVYKNKKKTTQSLKVSINCSQFDILPNAVILNCQRLYMPYQALLPMFSNIITH